MSKPRFDKLRDDRGWYWILIDERGQEIATTTLRWATENDVNEAILVARHTALEARENGIAKSRWRRIDPNGTISGLSVDPADEPDEGETGPEEVRLG